MAESREFFPPFDNSVYTRIDTSCLSEEIMACAAGNHAFYRIRGALFVYFLNNVSAWVIDEGYAGEGGIPYWILTRLAKEIIQPSDLTNEHLDEARRAIFDDDVTIDESCWSTFKTRLMRTKDLDLVEMYPGRVEMYASSENFLTMARREVIDLIIHKILINLCYAKRLTKEEVIWAVDKIKYEDLCRGRRNNQDYRKPLYIRYIYNSGPKIGLRVRASAILFNSLEGD
jgi:hypothetical protein